MRIRSLPVAAASAALVLLTGAWVVAAAQPTTLPAPVDYAYVRVLDAMVGQPALDVFVTRVAVDTPPNYAAVKFGTWTGYQKMYWTPALLRDADLPSRVPDGGPGRGDGLQDRQPRLPCRQLLHGGSRVDGQHRAQLHRRARSDDQAGLLVAAVGNLTSDVTKRSTSRRSG